MLQEMIRNLQESVRLKRRAIEIDNKLSWLWLSLFLGWIIFMFFVLAKPLLFSLWSYVFYGTLCFGVLQDLILIVSFYQSERYLDKKKGIPMTQIFFLVLSIIPLVFSSIAIFKFEWIVPILSILGLSNVQQMAFLFGSIIASFLAVLVLAVVFTWLAKNCLPQEQYRNLGSKILALFSLSDFIEKREAFLERKRAIASHVSALHSGAALVNQPLALPVPEPLSDELLEFLVQCFELKHAEVGITLDQRIQDRISLLTYLQARAFANPPSECAFTLLQKLIHGEAEAGDERREWGIMIINRPDVENEIATLRKIATNDPTVLDEWFESKRRIPKGISFPKVAERMLASATARNDQVAQDKINAACALFYFAPSVRENPLRAGFEQGEEKVPGSDRQMALSHLQKLSGRDNVSAFQASSLSDYCFRLVDDFKELAREAGDKRDLARQAENLVSAAKYELQGLEFLYRAAAKPADNERQHVGELFLSRIGHPSVDRFSSSSTSSSSSSSSSDGGQAEKSLDELLDPGLSDEAFLEAIESFYTNNYDNKLRELEELEKAEAQLRESAEPTRTIGEEKNSTSTSTTSLTDGGESSSSSVPTVYSSSTSASTPPTVSGVSSSHRAAKSQRTQNDARRPLLEGGRRSSRFDFVDCGTRTSDSSPAPIKMDGGEGVADDQKSHTPYSQVKRDVPASSSSWQGCILS